MSHTNSTQNCVQIFFTRLPNLYIILYTFLTLPLLGILRWMPPNDALSWIILASFNLHLNVPSSNWGLIRRFYHKCLVFGLGIMGPEFHCARAVGQWSSARRSVKAFRHSGYTDWLYGLVDDACIFCSHGRVHLARSRLCSFSSERETSPLSSHPRSHSVFRSLHRHHVDSRQKQKRRFGSIARRIASSLVFSQFLWPIYPRACDYNSRA
jgi:hypothetical protein